MDQIRVLFWNEYLRTCMCSLLSMGVGLRINVTLMRPKRSLRPLIIYLVFKSVEDVFLQAGILKVLYGDTRAGQFGLTVLGLCMSISTAMMFAYTFDGKTLEKIIGLIISEVSLTLVWLPCVVVVNYLENRTELFAFGGRLQLLDLLLFPLAAVTGELFCRITGPLLRKYRTFQFLHRKLLWCAIFGYILLSQSVIFFGGQESNLIFTATMYMLHLVFSVGIMGSIYIIYQRYQGRIRKENESLRMHLNLMESHYQAAWQQIHRIEKSRHLVDRQMQELTAAAMKQERQGERDEMHRRISSYLDELHLEYDRIQAGMYCNDWMVDAVLYCQTETAKRQGISMDCSLQVYERKQIPEDVVAQLFFQLLEFGIHENIKQKTRSEDPLHQVPQISLRTGNVKNFLAVEFSAACTNGRKFPVKTVKEQIKGYGEITDLRKSKYEIQAVIMLRNS